MNINYKKEMERALVSGVKLHTIRQKPIAVGTMMNHIVYPYHKERRCVLSNFCKSTQIISIEPTSKTIIVDGKGLSKNDMERLSKNDGFETMECVEKITIKAASRKAVLAFIDKSKFYSVLRNKLHWGISPKAF